MLESGSSILKAKRNNVICECALRCSKGCYVLILLSDLNLVVALKTIHEGYDFMADRIIDNFVNKWCGIIIFRACTIKLAIISKSVDITLFFVNRDEV